ncbi:DNA-binding transcriptional LysR family regulator [Rheinheimera pacifica]|uniref:LysR family transcriptional regulator n=1 Tax=Rheinheimera pacifica TaxID=173990 RepID=UPI0028592B4D|nr:LysR family transcriptional regulator [Rheinheimera pacifica]MDR6984116.1 DNA-binding transcriptional LysR family regulator [Rheinheimera pacifica]
MDVRQLSFRLLQVYIKVVQLGGISAAARELHLTQPTVSLQLKKLSEVVKEPLLHSSHSGLQPTAAGQALYQAACDVLSRFDDLNSELNELSQGRRGSLSIAVVNTAQYLMPRILAPFYRRFPQIEVTLHIGNRAQILSRFEQQQDDIYLFSHPPGGEHVLATPIVKNPLQLIAPLDHWATGQTQLSFNQLKQERFLLREPGSATRMMFEAWLSSQGIQLSHSMQIESNEAIRLSVAAGMGLSVISGHTLLEGREKLAVLDVAGFPLNSHWYLVRNADKRLSYAAQSLTGFIAAHLPECIEPDWLLDEV